MVSETAQGHGSVWNDVVLFLLLPLGMFPISIDEEKGPAHGTTLWGATGFGTFSTPHEATG